MGHLLLIRHRTALATAIALALASVVGISAASEQPAAAFVPALLLVATVVPWWRHPDLCLAALVALFPVAHAIPGANLLTAGVAGLWLVIWLRGNAIFAWETKATLALGWVWLALISVARSPAPLAATDFLLTYAGLFAIYFLVGNLAGSARSARLVAITWVLAQLPVALWLLSVWLRGELSDFLAYTEIHVAPGESPPPGPYAQLAAFLGDNNEAALQWVLGGFLGIHLAVSSRRHRRALGVASTLLLLGAILTGSRGGLLALVAAGAWLAWRERARRSVRIGAALAACALMVLVPAVLAARFGDADATDDASARLRTDLATAAWAIVRDHPFLGVGAGGFQATLLQGYTRPHFLLERFKEIRFAHSTWLDVLVENGFLGFAVFGTLLALAFRDLQRTAREGSEGTSALARGSMCALVGYAAGATFLSVAFSRTLWLILGLSFALGRSRREEGDRASRSVEVRDGP